MQTRTRPSRSRILRLGVPGCLLPVVAGLLAQPLPLGNFVATDFALPEFHSPPYENRLKSLLRGAEAVPQGNGLMLIKKVQLETFNEAGERELTMAAESCLYDMPRREARSESPLRIHTEDGQLRIEGEGFLWRQTDSSLIISNRVHTVIQWMTEDGPEP